ncbi:MAG: helix-turn-helix transcriptional regulator [Clostridia bacterium]|nr:helix-turn-helix transcriptional regulator [Clostridia bacterium]
MTPASTIPTTYIHGMKMDPCRTSIIAGIGSENCALHEEIELKCFYEGASTLLIGNRTVNVKAGDVVVINPYEFHSTVDCGEESTKGRYHLLMIPLDFFGVVGAGELKLRPLLLSDNKVFKTLFEQDNQLFDLLSRVATECMEKQEHYVAAVSGLMLEIFTILLRRGLCDTGNTDRGLDSLRSYHLIEPALRHIRDCYTNPISVDQLAALCNVSKHYFCHIFKTVTQKSAMEYLREYRIKIADVMLINTDKSVSQIAEGCGFESVAYFCRAYKRQYGISPGKRR